MQWQKDKVGVFSISQDSGKTVREPSRVVEVTGSKIVIEAGVSMKSLLCEFSQNQ